MKPFYRMTELELRDWCNQFAVALQTYGGQFSIPPVLIQQFADVATDYTGHVDSVSQMRRALDAEIALRDSSRESLLQQAGVLAARVKASPAANPSIITAMGLIPDAPARRSAPVFAPASPSVTTKTNGLTRVSWSRGQNTVGCRYVVEARRPLDSEWRLVGVTGGLKWDLLDTTVGETMYYRIVAQRNDRRSEPSEVVVAYGESDSLAA